MFVPFAKYYFLGLFFLVVFFGIGYFLLNILFRRFRLTKHGAVFASILLGSIIAILIFSIIQTRFRTINLGFLLVFGALAFELRKLPIVNRMTNAKSFFSLKKFTVFALAYL